MSSSFDFAKAFFAYTTREPDERLANGTKCIYLVIESVETMGGWLNEVEEKECIHRLQELAFVNFAASALSC